MKINDDTVEGNELTGIAITRIISPQRLHTNPQEHYDLEKSEMLVRNSKLILAD